MRTARRRAALFGSEPVAKNLRAHVPLRDVVRRVLDMGASAPSESTDALVGPTPPTPLRAEPLDPQVGELQRAAQPELGFDTFYRSNYATVVRLSYSLCGSMTVAEELAQESFVAAHRRWRRISTFDRPDLWVRRVVINRSISYRRKVASERKALLRFAKRRDDRSEIVLADEEVFAALRSLSSRQAEVLALVYLEDRPIAEVATILRLGEETVRTHLKRGRAALAAKLGDVREEAG